MLVKRLETVQAEGMRIIVRIPRRDVEAEPRSRAQVYAGVDRAGTIMGHPVFMRAINRATLGMKNVRLVSSDGRYVLLSGPNDDYSICVECEPGLQHEHREEWATR